MAAVMQQGSGHAPHSLGQAAAGGGGGGEKPNRQPGGHGNGGDDPNNRRCPYGKHFGPHRACRICGGKYK